MRSKTTRRSCSSKSLSLLLSVPPSSPCVSFDVFSVQKLQEAIYDKKHTTMAITVDTISDVLFDRVLYAVTDEVEHVIDDYAAKVVQKI